MNFVYAAALHFFLCLSSISTRSRAIYKAYFDGSVWRCVSPLDMFAFYPTLVDSERLLCYSAVHLISSDTGGWVGSLCGGTVRCRRARSASRSRSLGFTANGSGREEVRLALLGPYDGPSGRVVLDSSSMGKHDEPRPFNGARAA